MVILDENRNNSSTLTCLRLYNVKQEANETAEDCFHKVKEIIKVADLDIPDPVIDRAHRVGVGYNNKPPAMIVKFTTSRHRTKLYRARKEIKERFGYSLQVDLAKENLYTLKKVREIGKENREVTGFEFAYANINCVLYMKINGRFEKFTTVDEANQLMGINASEDVSDGSIVENSCSSGNSSSISSSSSSSGSSSDDPDKGDDGDIDNNTPAEKDCDADNNDDNGDQDDQNDNPKNNVDDDHRDDDDHDDDNVDVDDVNNDDQNDEHEDDAGGQNEVEYCENNDPGENNEVGEDCVHENDNSSDSQ